MIKKGVDVEPVFESEVWFLEVNNLPIAYQIVLIYKGTAFFVKTSFNEKFRKFSPGKFLIDFVLQEFFRKANVNKIDFITNLAFVSAWKPLLEPRKKFIIGKSSKLLRTFLYGLIIAQVLTERSVFKKMVPLFKILKFLELAVSVE